MPMNLARHCGHVTGCEVSGREKRGWSRWNGEEAGAMDHQAVELLGGLQVALLRGLPGLHYPFPVVCPLMRVSVIRRGEAWSSSVS